MQFNITTSKKNIDLVKSLSQKLGLGTENHISRIALAYSISRGYKLNPEMDLQDYKGKQYKDLTLFGNHQKYYVGIICQHYQLHKDDSNIKKYLKMHIDHGLELINLFFTENKNFSGMDFLLDNIEMGIDLINDGEATFEFTKNSNSTIEDKTGYVKPIKILVGATDKRKEIHFTPNNTKLYNNCHIAIAGTTGAGKSYLSLKILERIVKQSKQKVNFLYLDFKGLKKEDKDSPDFKSFFKNTKAHLINAPQDTFPVNPLSFIDIVNDRNKIVGIGRFVDIIVKFANLGNVQKQHLKDATINAFEEKKDGTYPTLKDILNNVFDIAGDKPSSLTQILIGLTEIELFDNDKYGDFINANYYFSLSPDLSKEVRFTSTFLVIYYLYNIFMNMRKMALENDHCGLRYVLLIDEAHNVFKEKKSQEILEKLLRDIRSQGVSVILASQSINEFNQKDFDFSSMCETAFLMDIKDKNNWRSISKFLGAGEKQRGKINRSMERIKSRQAIGNIKEFEFGKVFNTK